MTASMVDAFRQEARAAASTVHEVATLDEAVRLVATLADGGAVAVAGRLADDEVADALRAHGVCLVVPDDAGDPAEQVADVAVGVVRGELAVAETGSVLVSEHALADRVVSMLCRRLVQVVPRERLVPRLEEAAEWLADRAGAPGFASLMTGPSRSADIERSLTIGVQGPDEVDVVVVG
ncbi:LutC/YkgG family protein [Egibacter rhizosphaerae]|uniref:LutC/YkgG family protein n=1 Tax=Egibacter rhizosphaerae TaxID=1670831 RepID=UPI0013F14EF6|nr:LUD domain-containing protein [Egibacter rhizosphaerae]